MTHDLAISDSVQPIKTPPDATHFRLRKGGMNGTEVQWATNGVLTDLHTIDLFDKNTIQQRWGHDREYLVQFFKETDPISGHRKAIGTWKPFGLVPTVAKAIPEDEHDLAMAPYYPAPQMAPSSTMADSLAMLTSLKSIVDVEAAARVSEARASHESTLNIVTMLVRDMRQPAPQGVDPALAQILQGMAAQQAQTNALLAQLASGRPANELEPEDDEETEEEEEDRRYSKLVTAIKRDGMSALMTYIKEESMMGLIDALPYLKEKLPAVIEMMAPILQAKMAELMTPAASAPARPAPTYGPPQFAPMPVPAPAAPQYAPPPMPEPVAANGAVHAEAFLPPTVPDDESPAVA